MNTQLTEAQMQLTIGAYCKTIGKPWKTKILLMPKTEAKGNMEQIETIKSVICRIFGVSWDYINTTSRRREPVECRHAIIYFIRKHISLSLSDIGRLFKSKKIGGLDHSTIISSCKTYSNLMNQRGYAERHKAITEQLSKLL